MIDPVRARRGRARTPRRDTGAGEHMLDVLDVLEVRARRAGPSPAARAVRRVLTRLRGR